MAAGFHVQGIDVVYYHVPDMPAAERWYKDVLGLPVGQAFPGWSELQLPGDQAQLDNTIFPALSFLAPVIRVGFHLRQTPRGVVLHEPCQTRVS